MDGKGSQGGLEEIGVPGKEHLKEALTTCSDPLSAIEEFQQQNGILLPSLGPALPFLDLHGVQRYEFHQSVVEELRERMIQRIQEIAESNDKNKNKLLNDLLMKSFPVIKVKAMRPVVMCILKHMPKIKQEYLTQIVDDPELYREAAVEVKQQIWQDNQAMFGDEVSPLLSKYIKDKEGFLFNCDDMRQNFFTPSPKMRRQGEVMQRIVQMIGKNIKLYDMVLQFLRTLFLRSRNIHYCTLRAELLMALHDNEIHDICSVDPCHKFTWCLDACIRERFVDSKRARELQGFLDGVRRGQEQVLGDLSMILCDPYAINTIAMSSMKILLQTAAGESLPRTSDELILLLRMVALGLGAWQMIDNQLFKEPKLETPLITRFLPCVLSMMVDDQIHSLVTKLPDEPTPEIEAIPDFIFPVCQSNPVGCTILVYYCIQVAQQKDAMALCRILPALAQCDSDTVYQDTNLHLLVAHLSGMLEHFANIEFASAVIEQFFLPSVSHENVLRHLMRLLWWVHAKVSPNLLSQLMVLIQPKDHSPEVHSLYQALKVHLSTHQPSPTQEPVKTDSPLMGVPPPTPATGSSTPF